MLRFAWDGCVLVQLNIFCFQIFYLFLHLPVLFILCSAVLFMLYIHICVFYLILYKNNFFFFFTDFGYDTNMPGLEMTNCVVG